MPRWIGLLILCGAIFLQTGIAHATTPAEKLISILQKEAPKLLTSSGEIQAAIDAGLISKPIILNNFPSPPDGKLTNAISGMQDSGENTNLTVQWLPEFRIGMVYSLEGTEEFLDPVIFTADSQASHLASTPDVLALGSCVSCGIGLYLGTYDHHAVALMEREDPLRTGMATNRMIVAAQSWDGSQWSQFAAFAADLRYSLNPEPDFVSCLTNDCAEVTRLGFLAASKFYPSQTPKAISMPLTPNEANIFAKMKSLVVFHDPLLEKNISKHTPGPTDIVPVVNGKTLPARDKPWDHYNSDSVVFPARLNGVLVLGRIGHGTIGWRVNGDWNIGFWKLDENKLVPVGAAIFMVEDRPVITSLREVRSLKLN